MTRSFLTREDKATLDAHTAPAMNKVSVILICQDEESRIRSCLESVSWADEIVVVDSGSTDKTLEIAREYTRNIHIQSDWQGFGPQKRFAEEQASHDWIFSIDADEIVSEELKRGIIDALKKTDERAVYRVNRLTSFCGKMIRHSGWHPDWIVRLYNKKHYHFNDEIVHEQVACKGAKATNLPGYLYHNTLESLDDYIDKRNRYARAWAENRLKKGRSASIFDIVTRPPFAFVKHYFLKLGFLDGFQGFLISVIQAQYTFNKYCILKYLRELPNEPGIERDRP